MNLSQMTAFRAVMEAASLSAAAEKLGRTQPAVSLAIRSLEDSLGLKLFERRGRQLVPVPEAHYLHAETSDILDRLSSVAGTMKSLTAGQSGSLNVASMPGPSTFLFPRYISRFTGSNPRIRISLSSRTSPQIRELAATQGFDFGFADMIGREASAQTFRQETIAADCFCAIPQDHPLAQKQVIAWKDLDNVPLGLLQSTHITHQKTVAELRRAGGTPNVVLDSQFFLPMMPFISAGRCLSVVDPLTAVTEHEVDSTGGRVVFRQMEGGFRYEYTIISPVFRPLSQLALQIKDGWKNEVMDLLAKAGARPEYFPSAPEQ
ncbi:LysR family transcriptional regulator [Leisingera aquaemixtae]|uniref:LysR family transcriptional regulator n=1 Tax=Leisingera aquaemixtae TaxID=1396826 RepID=UPI001C9606CC|nr:LysR substrate-binding domain-containing protein [Leisingera aquaemixtae]MBY6069530.1 LysR family transcriptional regulator [Leisingera aquaemixtae]